VNTRRRIACTLALALALVTVAIPANAIGDRVVATGPVSGTQKVRGCTVQAEVAFTVDLSSGNGRLHLVQHSTNLACLAGTDNIVWENYCREDDDGRIVCGDDDLSTEDTPTAILHPDGTFAFEDQLFALNGTLVHA
jgi:hypothetical protein